MKTLIFGHKNPDTDSITSSIVMEHLEKKLGNNEVKAYKLGKVNKETEFVLNYFKVAEPETLESIEEKANEGWEENPESISFLLLRISRVPKRASAVTMAT